MPDELIYWRTRDVIRVILNEGVALINYHVNKISHEV